MVARISTNMIYDRGVTQLSTLQSNLLRTQLQLSTGRRVLTPADDPVASARSLEVTQSQQMNEQFSLNRQTARSSLDQVDTVLQSVGDVYTEIQSTLLAAGNPGLSPADRETLAVDLESNLKELLGLANTADGTGNYLFSGYKSTTLPFALTETGADYYGDQGQRELRVGSTRTLPISASGSQIFEQNITGNGTFLTKPGLRPDGTANTGNGIIAPGTVVDAAALTGHNYTIDFQTTPTGVLQYRVTDTDLNTEPVPFTDFKAGQPIKFDGISFDIAGTPEVGDTFTVEPSTNQSVFETVRNAITALRTAGTGPTANAKLTNALNEANQNMRNALDNSLSVLALVGARGRELDYLDNSGSAFDIQYQAQISDLIEVDPIEAASRFAQQSTNLQAAQQTFKTATSLSLFNYI